MAKLKESGVARSLRGIVQMMQNFVDELMRSGKIGVSRIGQWLPFVLLFVLSFAAVFFGGVHVWVRTVFSLAIFFFFLLFLWAAEGNHSDPAAARFETPTAEGLDTGNGNHPEKNEFRFQMDRGEPAVSIHPAEHEGRETVSNGTITQTRVSLILDPPSLAGIFFVAWGFFHLLPLPEWFLRLVSPESLEVWSFLDAFGVHASRRISLYPFMTWKTLLLTAAFLLFYWLALYGLRGKKEIRWMVWGILLLGVFESLYGLVQLAGDRNIILWWENPFSGNVLTGTFINRNHLAGFLSMSVCVAVGYLWSLGREGNKSSRRGRRRRFYQKLKQTVGIVGAEGIFVTLALALMAAAVLVSASRGGFLSLVCGIVFMGGLITARYFKSRRGFAIMVLLSLVLTYVGYVAADRIAERFGTFFNVEDRLAMARDTLAMGQSFPLAGAGGGTFEFVYPRFQQFALDKIVDYAHNDWVQLTAEYGWAGFGCVLAALAVFLAMTVSRWRRRHDAFTVGIGLGGMGAVVTIAIHSLSDFNLHIPANFLLLSLVVALTWRVLYSSSDDGGTYEGPSLFFPLGPVQRTAGGFVITALIVAASFMVVQIWRADSLARTFRNSTIPEKQPVATDLRRARNMTPGNAAYWMWSADRLRMNRAEKKELLNPAEMDLPEPEVYLLFEGLKRNPSSWQIWRELGWTFFLASKREGQIQEASLRNASRCLDLAASLRPADVRLQMDSGSAALYAWRLKVAGIDASVWQDHFRKALKQEPGLAGNIADVLVLHLGPSGGRFLKSLLPSESRSYLGAAAFLLARGYDEVGLDLVREGEKRREAEIEQLWTEIRAEDSWPGEAAGGRLDALAKLDRDHPGVLLSRGNLIGVLKQIERRGEPIGKWQETRAVAHFLKTELDEGRGDPILESYYLGLLYREEGNITSAVKWMNRTLNLNSQFFPAWLHLRDMMKNHVRSVGDEVELERLGEKIQLFAMKEIVSDAWKPLGIPDGMPTWKAPLRIADTVGRVTLRFAASERAPWALYLDGRFVEAWTGTAWEGRAAVRIPPGEHELRLVTWNKDMAGYGKFLPFRLEVDLDQ